MATDDAVKAAIDELYKSLSIDRIIGEPIDMGDKVILPIARMGIILGAGLNLKAQKNCTDGRAGGGFGVYPVSVVIIFKEIKGPEGIRVMPITTLHPQIELAESLGQMASAVMSRLMVGEAASENNPSNNPHTAKVELK